jgi:hypothetical protein
MRWQVNLLILCVHEGLGYGQAQMIYGARQS